MSSHLKGFLITALGVLILSPDSLLIRLVNAEVLVVSFWRGLLSGLVILGLLLITRPQFLFNYVKKMSGFDYSSTLFFTGGNIFFVYSINHTQVAHALIILALTPLFASVFSRIFLHESISKQTILTIVIAFLGASIMAYGDLQQSSSIQATQKTLMGDLAALGATLCLAANLTMVRAKITHAPMITLALAGLITALFSWLGTDSVSLPSESWLPMLIMGLFVMPISFTLITLGPRYITSTEVGLLMLLETVMGPLLVWWYLHEEPSLFALTGGGIILGALIVLNSYQLLKYRRVLK